MLLDEENEHAMFVTHGYHRFLSGDVLSETSGQVSYPDESWLATTPRSKLETSFRSIQRVLDTRMIPLLDSIRTMADLVQVFEAGTLSFPDAFSSLDFLADCYIAVGRPEHGIRSYEAYLSTFETLGTQEWLAGERGRLRSVFRERART